MSRIFRLGDFFGITATQLVLFKPGRFEDLLNCHYTSQVSESLYSLRKELGFLKEVLTTDAMKPDYERLIEDFKLFGYLGLTSGDNDGKATMKIAKFYKDSDSMPMDELRATYGETTDEMLSIIKESLTIDVASAFPNISSNCVAVVNAIFKNYDYLDELINKCKASYEMSNIHEAQVAGRPIRDIIELDRDGSTGNIRCCAFVNQLLTKVRLARNPVQCASALKELEHDIENIQREYEAKDIEITPVEVIAEILNDVYNEMTVERFKEITGLDATDEEINSMFKELDSFEIGGMGFNSREMGQDVISAVSHEDTRGWSVKSKEHNEKLDALLNMAYIDLKSRQYMLEL